MRHGLRRVRRDVALPLGILAILALVVTSACEAGSPPVTPTPVAGTPETPREVNLIARDYSFQPPTFDVVPGETVLLHVVNGGLEVHETVIGGAAVQDAWEAAEARTVGAPPGPTPVVSVPPGVSGLRVVVRSGERVDVRWTVPPLDETTTGAGDWIVGCHIPGHSPRGCGSPSDGSPDRHREGIGWYALERIGPVAPRTIASRRTRMTYVIAEPCIDVLDLSCVSVCPVDCIHYEEGVDRKLFIDPNECIDCGACEPECPVNAIFPEESLPPEWANYTAIDATWYTDKAAARAAVDEAKPSG